MNLLVSDISEQLGYGSLELFSFTLISIPIWLAGAVYLVLARVLLPDRAATAMNSPSTPRPAPIAPK